jgi:hypothetical protein
MSTDTGPSGRKPSHRLYQVIGEGEHATWIQIGAAWPNKDAKGFSLACDAVPLSGRIVMREMADREPEQERP